MKSGMIAQSDDAVRRFQEKRRETKIENIFIDNKVNMVGYAGYYQVKWVA